MTPDKEQVVERLSASDASYPCIRCGTSLWHCGAPADPCCGDSDHPFATVEETIRALNDDLQAEHQSIADAARTASVAGLDRERLAAKHRKADPPLPVQWPCDVIRLLNSAPSIEQEPGETLRAAVLYGPDVEFPNLPNGPYLTGPDVLLAVAHYMDRQDDEAERMAAGSGYRANRDVQAHLREWSRRLRAALNADPQETER